MEKEKQVEKVSVVNPYAAGIDVGARKHFVAIGQGKEHVKTFGVYSDELHDLCKWLKQEHIETVALEATGNYWKNLFVLLQEYSLNPILVSGRFTRNVKGRKTDMLDCQWIQHLHRLGLLPDSFQPELFTEQLRHLSRHRQGLISNGADCIKRMQKVLVSMNVRLDVAVSDITGKSGTAIIKAIIAGEQNPVKLTDAVTTQVHKSKEEITRALTGHFRPHAILELRHHYNQYETICVMIKECDSAIEKMLRDRVEQNHQNDLFYENRTKKKKYKNHPNFDLQEISFRYFDGIDLSSIPGISLNTLLIFISEVGHDIKKFPSPKAFCKWLRLTPENKVTGGRVIGRVLYRGPNNLAIALRQAANSIGNLKGDTPLLSFFKRIAYRRGRAAAITATARKVAVIIWNMLHNMQQYTPTDNSQYLEKIRLQELRLIKRKITKLAVSREELLAII